MTRCRTKPTVPISFHAVHSCIHTAAAKLSCGTEPFTAYKPKIFILLPFTGNNSDDTRFSVFPFCHTCWLPCFHPDSSVSSPKPHEILASVLSRISSLALPPFLWTLLVTTWFFTKHPIAISLFNLFCIYSLNPRNSLIPD